MAPSCLPWGQARDSLLREDLRDLSVSQASGEQPPVDLSRLSNL